MALTNIVNAAGQQVKFKALQELFNILSFEDQEAVRRITAEGGGDTANAEDVLRTLAQFDQRSILGGQLIDKGGPEGLSARINEAAPPTPAEEAETDQDTIDDLIESERIAGEEFITGEEERRKTRRGELAGLLGEQREQAFDTNAPGILESLGGRGLLHSSAVGEEFAEEKGRLQQLSENILSQQGLADIDVIGGFRQGALGREIDIRRAGVAREFSVEDQATMAALARQLAQIQASSQKSSEKSDLFGNVLSAGATVGAAFI